MVRPFWTRVGGAKVHFVFAKEGARSSGGVVGAGGAGPLIGPSVSCSDAPMCFGFRFPCQV